MFFTFEITLHTDDTTLPPLICLETIQLGSYKTWLLY